MPTFYENLVNLFYVGTITYLLFGGADLRVVPETQKGEQIPGFLECVPPRARVRHHRSGRVERVQRARYPQPGQALENRVLDRDRDTWRGFLVARSPDLDCCVEKKEVRSVR